MCPEYVDIVLSPQNQRDGEFELDCGKIVRGPLALREWTAYMENSYRQKGKTFWYKKFGLFAFQEHTYRVDRAYKGLLFRFDRTDNSCVEFKMRFYCGATFAA